MKKNNNLSTKLLLHKNYIKLDKKNNLIIKLRKINTKKNHEISLNIDKSKKFLLNDEGFCEVYNVENNKIIKLFLDIDLKYPLTHNINKLSEKRKKIYNDFQNEWFVVDFSRKTEKLIKISFHLIHKKIAFSNYKSLQKFVKDFIIYEGVDLIYKSYFCLRCPGQSKWGEEFGNKGIIKNGVLSDTFITANFKNYDIFEYIDIGEPINDDTEIYNEEIISQLLDILLPEYYDDYNLWVKICYALKNMKSERSYDLFIEFSKKSKKYIQHTANKLWFTPNNIDAQKITPKSIYYFAKLSNENEYFNIIKPKNYREKLMSQNGLTYQDFTIKWNNKRLTDTKIFMSELREVVGYYDKGLPIFIFKNKEGIFLSKKHNLKNYHIYLNDKRYSFWDIIQINNITSIQYNSIKFKPEKMNKNIFNLWSGFKSKPIKNNDLIKPIINHIKYVWANNIKERFQYIINWLAKIIQEPWRKNGTVIVLIGGQGCGKNILCNFLMDNLIGEKYSTTINNLNTITKRFNCLLEHKILITLDEVSNVKNNYHKTFDILKSLITEKTQKIERKGLDPIIIDDFCNYIMLSNNYYPVKVEGMDRRYAIFNCSNKYIKNKDYFQKLKDSFTENTANAFMDYLMNIDISNVELSNIPTSKIREELIERSVPDELVFLHELIENKQGEKISSEIIWDEYCIFCAKEGCKIKKKRIFLLLLNRYMIKKRCRINGIRTRFYTCDLTYFKEKVMEINHYIL
jgi:hypothetical protein